MTTTPEHPAGDAVVVDAVNGDHAAMDALWHEHRRWIAAVLLAHKSAEDQVEDLLQEVAMTIVSKINTLRDTRHVRSWLRTVAVNAARASARRHRARPRLEFLNDEVDPDACGGGDTTALDEEAQRVMALAQQLPETYREPLMLRAIHGMRGKHIASIMGLSEATVETRIARGRRMLRDLSESSSSGRRSVIVGSISGGVLRKGSA